MKKQNKKLIVVLIIIIVCVIPIIYFWIIDSRNKTTKEMTGIVTRKFTDCAGGEEMNSEGNITSIRPPFTCDGGNTITIDYGHKFQTSTGNVPDADAYNIDVSNIKVGDKVKVIYIGNFSLHCEKCSVTKQD